ncbi:sugar ABC transporter ATP-binding protein [Marinomonas foliarum]|uniref:Monosaccharide ABC transporter ATP-binding protein (CUT2 family) n=1 Tax=Marinomonas foliarum TaxID=491950 RepID=A0A369AHV7_9GAMM|nr:sugar ABC transporter ATP-binding protein [Marinomonas foliarum]RCX08751.1 monosaccharide ABC transporter ATP-binding protein (CUT2 family) [Marinomonas foliarum]
MTIIVEMHGISKAFGHNQVLNSVSFSLNSGSVHALMGENGAGKSTLMKILAGVHQPDAGQVKINGQKVNLLSPRDALDSGISTVFQEHSLLPNLSIAENMFLGREPLTRTGAIDYDAMIRDTRRALDELGLDLDPTRLVSTLTIGERQFVEIAHGIEADASVMILDEPTAALNAADVEVLNTSIRKLCERGKAVVYISHRMEEIFNICDTVTVLKDGKLVGEQAISDLTPNVLIEMMVGRELTSLFPARSTMAGEVVLELKDIQLTENARPLSLTLHRGEIVALAGLEGQGQQKLSRALIGQHALFSGQIRVKGVILELPFSGITGIRRTQKLGLGFVPEDRKEEGLFLELPILHNIVIGLHSRRAAIALVRKYRPVVADIMQSMNVKAPNANARVRSLSGGNQQKVLLGRYLAAKTDILVIEEPTRGVDIGAKSEIYRLLREFTEQGGAILVLSRETLELIGLSDRLYVVHENTIVAEMLAIEATEHSILNAALKTDKKAHYA